MDIKNQDLNSKNVPLIVAKCIDFVEYNGKSNCFRNSLSTLFQFFAIYIFQSLNHFSKAIMQYI